MRASLLLVFALAACGNTDDPASYVTGLRVLAIAAEPPDVPVGASSTLTALALDTDGTAVELAWSRCLTAPPTGDPIDPDCITGANPSKLASVGDGLSLAVTMPDVTPATLARPDASGGVYVPYVTTATAGDASLVGSYALRLNLGTTPNQNPMLDAISIVDGDAITPLDDASPPVVHAGDEITLRATFVAGSAETYEIDDTTPPRSVTETLSADWYSTAGLFSSATTGADVPDMIFHLDTVKRGPTTHLPASGSTIDLWVVGRDERGGTDWQHHVLSFE